MGLLTPLFLLAGLAVAIPFIVHLRRRDRANVVVFPSLMFLRGGPPPTAKRRRLQHLLLLTVRSLVVLLLAFAFARPFLTPPAGVSGGGSARDLVILLDRSASMRVGDRWDRAVREVEREIGMLSGDDRATIIAFAHGAESLVELTGDPTLLRVPLATVQPVGGATRYAPAVQLAGRVLTEQGRGAGEVVFIGDLQRTGWMPDDLEPLPSGTLVRAISTAGVADMPPAIRSLNVAATADGARELRAVTVTLDAAADAASYVLELDGRVAETVTATPLPDGGAEARFVPVPIPERPMRAIVRPAVTVPAPDSGARLMLERGRRREVLVLRQSAAGGGDYAATALRAASEPPVSVTVVRGTLPANGELERYSAILLDDASVPAADAARLRGWVERGGGLVIATAASADQWSDAMAEVAGTRGGTRVQRPQGAVASVDAGHPAFVLAGVPARELVGARISRYTARDEEPGWTSFARFDDGAPALAERRLGRGRVVVWSAGFDESSGALVRHPAFPPLVHALVLYSAGFSGGSTTVRPGDALDLAALVADDPAARADPPREGERLTLAAPGGDRRPVVVREGTAAARVDDAGFYEVRREAADADPRLVAVNVDPSEYIAEEISDRELVAAIAPATTAAADVARAAAPPAPSDIERRQRLWWWVLAAVAVLLSLEALLANRLSRPHVAAPVGGRRL